MSYLTFFMAAVVLAITPGPGLAYVVARTASGGRREGIASSMGTAVGGIVHVVASALGLSLLIANSAILFGALKGVGALYLAYLGITLLRRGGMTTEVQTVVPQGARRAFLDGILVEVFNVKTALFFLAFLPQFVHPSEPLVRQLVLLGSICVSLNTFVDLIGVMAAHRLLGSSAARAARAQLMNRISGSIMLCLAIFLACTRRSA